MTQRFYAWGIVAFLLILSGCSHSQDETDKTDDQISITKWTEKTELFVEFARSCSGEGNSLRRTPYRSRDFQTGFGRTSQGFSYFLARKTNRRRG